MKKLILPLLLVSSLAMADEPATTVFLGLIPSKGMDKSLADRYSQCLQKVMQARGALTFIDNKSLDKSEDLLLNSGTAACDEACQSALARSAGAAHVLAGTLETNPIGFHTTLHITYADTTKKVSKIDWYIVGKEADLLGDGCKNGGAVIYNFLVTPPTTPNPLWPAGYNIEAARDHGLDKGDIFKLVAELRARESKDGAADQKNPAGQSSGGEHKR